MRTLALLASSLVAVAVVAVFVRPTFKSAEACSGVPEQFDELVRAADLIAIVRADLVDGATNAAPTIEPTMTALPPYPLEDLSGIGATLRVGDVIAGTADRFITADRERRAVIETRERELEAVWPGLAVNCSVKFGTWPYEESARYVGLFRWTGSEFETMRLVKIDGSNLDPAHGISFSKAAYGRYFRDLPSRNANNEPGDDYDYIYIEQPTMPVERFIAFIRSVRGEAISPPETGSGGLRVAP